MPKLRKMLGRIDDPQVIALMRLIETQCHQTLARWAMNCAKTRYLPLTEDPRLTEGIAAAEAWLAGTPLKELKPALRAAALAGREAEEPVCQAASRAVATACAVIQTPTNALGYTFYGAAAAAYHQAGLNADAATYDRLADEEITTLYTLLEQIAIADEPNPVKITWGC